MSAQSKTVDYDDLQDLVASNDSGGRNPTGFSKKLIVVTAILWSLFQIYYTSPFPFWLQEVVRDWGWNLNVVVDDTKARSIHLAFAMFLAFLSFPLLPHRRNIVFLSKIGYLQLSGHFLRRTTFSSMKG